MTSLANTCGSFQRQESLPRVAVRKLKFTDIIIEGRFPQFNETLTEH
jgi:hypothetical protein